MYNSHAHSHVSFLANLILCMNCPCFIFFMRMCVDQYITFFLACFKFTLFLNNNEALKVLPYEMFFLQVTDIMMNVKGKCYVYLIPEVSSNISTPS